MDTWHLLIDTSNDAALPVPIIIDAKPQMLNMLPQVQTRLTGYQTPEQVGDLHLVLALAIDSD